MRNTDKLFQLSNVDAVLLISEKNRLYFTGFASTFGYLVLLRNNKYIFITDPRYYEMAQELEKDGVEVRQIENGKSTFKMVEDIFTENKVESVGYEDNELTVSEFSSITEYFNKYKFVACGNSINTVRCTKEDDEIELVKIAQRATDMAFSDILTVIKPGMTEKEIAVELEYRLRKHGGTGLAFDTIIASGVNSSKPHAHPTDKKVENGDAITMDFGASYNGYCSDMTRTIFLGEPSAEMRKIYNIVLMAQTAAIKNAYCGMTGKEYDSFAREIIVANGYGDCFTHSLGHSLGIDIHENPRGSKLSDDIIGNNMFITAEPGIYVPGFGGVRIEDLLLIKEDGVIDLITSEKNIIIL